MILFKLKSVLGPPTQEKAYKMLLQKQLEDALSGKEKFGIVKFINDGLRLERDQ